MTVDVEALKPTDHAWHVTRRGRWFPTDTLRPGMLLPPRRSWDHGLGQLVLDVAYPQEAGKIIVHVVIHDYDAGEDYELDVRQDGGVYCPEMRSDPVPEEARASHPNARGDKSYDWRLVGPPKASDVEIGDLLPHRYEGELNERIGPQTVIDMGLDYRGRIVLSLRDRHAQVRYVYFPGELVVFPKGSRGRTGSLTQGLSRIERDLAMMRAIQNAPAVAWIRNPETKQVFRIIRHPSGRGKWPPEIPPFHQDLKTHDGVSITCRPPTTEQREGYLKCETLSEEEARELENVTRFVPATNLDWSGVPGGLPPASRRRDDVASTEVLAAAPVEMPPPPDPDHDPIAQAKAVHDSQSGM